MKNSLYVLLAFLLFTPLTTLAESAGSSFTYQGELRQLGLPANGSFDFFFTLYDAAVDGNVLGSQNFQPAVEVVDGRFTVELDFGTEPFAGDQLWLQIAVREESIAPRPPRPTTLSPRQKLTAAPYALQALRYDGIIDVSQIEGLLGDGFSLQFPDVLNNSATLEIAGIPLLDDVVIITGPGVDIEVIEGFDPSGRPRDLPGVAAEHPFVFETGTPDDVAALTNYFDQYALGLDTTRSISLIIDYGNGTEFSRINLFEYEPEFYEPGVDGRTRFHLQINEPPDNVLRWEIGGVDLFQDVGSFNPATDKLVEITGIATGPFFPEVVHDETNRTLTFTYTHDEGNGIVDLVRNTVLFADVFGLRSLSVIEWTGTEETGRTNYFETFPIRFEITGYGLNTKLVGTVVVKYAFAEPG